jgi:hypothetical protein
MGIKMLGQGTVSSTHAGHPFVSVVCLYHNITLMCDLLFIEDTRKYIQFVSCILVCIT